MIEAKFVETTKHPQKDLGINWSGTLLNHEATVGGGALSDAPGLPPKVITDVKNTPVSGLQWVKPPGGSMITPWDAGTAALDIGTAKLIFSLFSQDPGTECLAYPPVVTTANGQAQVASAEQYPIPQHQLI